MVRGESLLPLSNTSRCGIDVKRMLLATMATQYQLKSCRTKGFLTSTMPRAWLGRAQLLIVNKMEERERGNNLFSRKKYDEAIEAYTLAIVSK